MNDDKRHRPQRIDTQRVRRDVPLDPAQATQLINTIARDDRLRLSWQEHANDQLKERSLIIGDVLYVLKYGYVFDEAQGSTRKGYFKYLVVSGTPNSDGRKVRLVVIPGENFVLKIITVMWEDEPMTRS